MVCLAGDHSHPRGVPSRERHPCCRDAMGLCCGREARQQWQVADEKPSHRTSTSRVAPMSVLPAVNDDIHERLVKALSDEILPFVKQHCAGVYEQAFHAFRDLASNCPLGEFHAKLPGVLLRLLQVELQGDLAQAKKKRIGVVALKSFEASRSITHQRILKFFRQTLSASYGRIVTEGMLAPHAAAARPKKTSTRRGAAGGDDGSQQTEQSILAGLVDVLGPAVKLTQTLREARRGCTACVRAPRLVPCMPSAAAADISLCLCLAVAISLQVVVASCC